MLLIWTRFQAASPCFREQTSFSSVWLPDFPQTDSLFCLISSCPLEPDRQPFSCLLAFAQAVLTAWMHSSLRFANSNVPTIAVKDQGGGVRQYGVQGPQETLAKEVAI